MITVFLFCFPLPQNVFKCFVRETWIYREGGGTQLVMGE